MKFFVAYLLTALIGTVVIYHAAPLFRVPASRPAAATAQACPAASKQPEASHAAQEKTQSALAKPAAPVVASTPCAVATAPSVTASNEAVPSVNRPAAPAASGPNQWGLTLTQASYYSTAGERRGFLPGGALVDIDSRVSSSRGEMAMGKIERDNGMTGPFLVAMSDLVYFTVPRGDLPAENLQVLKQYYGLKGQLDQRIAELKQDAVEANPYAAAYRRAAQDYNAFGARELELTARRNKASGAERMRLVDELRSMIPENTRLKRALDDAKANYAKWKTSHPAGPAPDVARDEKAQDLQRRIAALEPKAKEILQ